VKIVEGDKGDFIDKLTKWKEQNPELVCSYVEKFRKFAGAGDGHLLEWFLNGSPRDSAEEFLFS